MNDIPVMFEEKGFEIITLTDKLISVRKNGSTCEAEFDGYQWAYTQDIPPVQSVGRGSLSIDPTSTFQEFMAILRLINQKN